ncbi:MAG TPA: hypothetical protein VGP65_02900, partial [Candidatus Angelobacter sp.]|nr:hypothetical protein [Candidatus Angelobacter sp.]
LLLAWPEAMTAEVTASPERKSLRFMVPHFCGGGDAEEYQKRTAATSCQEKYVDLKQRLSERRVCGTANRIQPRRRTGK